MAIRDPDRSNGVATLNHVEEEVEIGARVAAIEDLSIA